MPKASPIQSSFNVGEISPLLFGRVDQEWYPAALATCLNYIPLIQGPVTRRGGTYWASEVKDSSRKTRVFRFEYSTTQAYIIEFGHLYCRFYKDNALITLTAQSITGITKANPAVVTYDGADTYANGDRVIITGAGGMGQVNNREFTVANVNAGANTFELSGVDSAAYDAYTSGGTVAAVYEISTPYAEADLFDLKFTQSADTLYIRHPSYARRKLTRSAHTSWTLSLMADSDGPYLPTNTTSTTLTPSAATGTGITITASSTTGINGGSGFASTDVGRMIRLKEGTTWGWVKIVGFTSTTVVTADVQSTLTNINAKATWRLGLWSDTTGYPACATFFEDRLWEGGNTSNPSRVDGSESGDYESFQPTDPDGTVVDSHAISYTLNANTVQNIRWMLDDEKGLLIGTVGGEWIVRSSTTGAALTPTNVSAKQSTPHGSANIAALRASSAVLFIQRSKRKLREIAYNLNLDKLTAPDRTVRAEHITKGGLVDMAYQQEPSSIVWLVRADGALLGFTFDQGQGVLSWHKHTLGGAFSTGSAVVESVAVIPAPDEATDELWMVVKRTINGATKRYVEYLTGVFEDGDAITDAFFVDAGLTYSGVSTATITGLWHLEGQTVSVLADGAVVPDRAVSNGKITLPQAASAVHVGLGFTSRVKLLRQEAGAHDGTAQGKLKRIARVVVRFLASVGLTYGKLGSDEGGTLDDIVFRDSGMDTNTAIPPFTGDKRVSWPGDWDREAWAVFEQKQPLPSTICAVMPQLQTEDDS